MKIILQKLAILFLFLISQTAFGDNTSSWETFITELRVEAIAQGIRPAIFDEAFLNIHSPSPRVLHLDHTQPERRLSFLEYRDTRVDNYRIQLGRREWLRHQEALDNISRQYGINACFIVSIWGLETSYGRYKGNFPVIQSLATLAYDPRRSAYFRHELFMALQMLNNGQVNLKDFKGEWAGASGHCQFMPSTWLKYATSYQAAGKADIWNNVDDALASIANFLEKNGWHKDEPWAISIALPLEFDIQLLGTNIVKPVKEWLELGVKITDDASLPPDTLPASIISFNEDGPTFMVFDNFKTLLKWNRSNYYAGTLGYLAEEICQQKL